MKRNKLIEMTFKERKKKRQLSQTL